MYDASTGDAAAQRPENPFSSRFVRPGAIEFLFPAGITAASLVDAFLAGNRCGQIVGPHGSGKSTLLAALERELARREISIAHVELHDGERRLPNFAPPSNGGVLVVDGYEQLGWWARRKLRRLRSAHRLGLLVTTHRSAGFATLYETTTTPQLAEQLTGRLLAEQPGLSPAEIREAYEQARGNLRELFFRLYDLYESRRS